jgi:hypothetical protein
MNFFVLFLSGISTQHDDTLQIILAPKACGFTFGIRVTAKAALAAKLRAPRTLPPSFNTMASTYTTQQALPDTTLKLSRSKAGAANRKESRQQTGGF